MDALEATIETDLVLCGLALDDIGDVTNVLYRTFADGSKELLFLSNDYIYCIYGLQELDIRPMNVDKGKDSDEYQHFKDCLLTQLRGKTQVIVALADDSVLIIEDIEDLGCVKQPTRLGTRDNEPYTGFVDVATIDEDDEDAVVVYSMQ